jgi:hypothetical protein
LDSFLSFGLIPTEETEMVRCQSSFLNHPSVSQESHRDIS